MGSARGRAVAGKGSLLKGMAGERGEGLCIDHQEKTSTCTTA